MITCHVKTYYEHETVFTSGDYNEEVCLVLKGKLRLVANREANSRSAPLEIAYLTPGKLSGRKLPFPQCIPPQRDGGRVH